MNPFFGVAAALVFLISFVHSYFGEKKLIGPLLLQESRNAVLEDSMARIVLRVAWHLTTLAWAGMGAVILLQDSATETNAMIVHAMGATFALTGLALLITTRARHRAWIVFFAIAGCLWAGLA